MRETNNHGSQTQYNTSNTGKQYTAQVLHLF